MKNILPRSRKSVRGYISGLLLTSVSVMLVVTVVLFILFLSFNRQYANALQNANIAADFNTDFKNTIDSEMYTLVIRPQGEDPVLEPLQELDNAVSVLYRLEGTTVLSDNRWRISSMLNMCENLEKYMRQIASEPSYDARMELLEKNIRGETGLTLLIENFMHDYIGEEVRELARLQDKIQRQALVVAVVMGVIIIAFSAATLFFSVRAAGRITDPISSLSEKVASFGGAGYRPEPIITDISELQTLDRGFDEMSSRIDALMEKQKQDQLSLHRAELELLQAQINPHFLYNTLDSILILAESDRLQEAAEMVSSLSSFFRISLSKGKDIITLADERDHVTSYLNIQQVRYSDILRFEVDIPEDILGCRLPKLVLQPLVENALYHGIKNKRGRGLIRVTGEKCGEDIVLKVSDNGAGMTPENLEKLQAGIYNDRHSGLGLYNVHKRIRLYAGEPYGLSFESEPGKGTVVSVLLPGMDSERSIGEAEV